MGATFAYFSLTSTAEGSSSTTFNGSVGDVGNFGVVSLTGVVSELELDLSAADMSQTIAGQDGKSYYAFAKTVSAQVASKKLVDDFGLTAAYGNYTAQQSVTHYDAKQNHIISAATLTGQTGVNGAKITCKSTVTVKIDPASTMLTDETAKTFMTAAGSEGSATKTNGKVYIAKPLNDDSNTHKVTVTDGEIDLKDLFAAEDNSKTATVTYVFNGSEEGKAAAYVTADVELINSAEGQNALANKTLKINITNDNFTCDVTNVGTPAD